MSKKSKKSATTTHDLTHGRRSLRQIPTAATFAEKVVGKYLSNDELYSELLDQVSADDFQQLENAIIARWDKARPEDPDERYIAEQEVFFMLGLEIGRRIGGVR